MADSPGVANYPSVLAVSNAGGSNTPRPFLNSSIQQAVDKAMSRLPADSPGAKLSLQGADGHLAAAFVWRADDHWTVGFVIDHKVGTSAGKGTDWAAEVSWSGK